ncbi:hypothetical protein AVEN_139934-1 [Araneus ventricosus]|uniref:Uncharacterized protein n=1 Tax=Araneus ventricosus TaxID=182803 RepID=A0A4Y2FZB5_ARAVE|nr:hypothetical protein AVEN_139934-1 [Araneus ventricosus]
MQTTILARTTVRRRRIEFSLRHCVMSRKCAISVSRQTCFASGVVDYAMLLCRNFTANLSCQVCHDKIISRKSQTCRKCACYLRMRSTSDPKPAPSNLRAKTEAGHLTLTDLACTMPDYTAVL